jgi:glycosyltransferase involved in cell wall biosynthesis
MTKPLVSVIMPAYNEARTISESMDSVLAQTFGDWELIVVDDGSIDDTRVIVDRYAARDKRIRCIGQKNKGPAAARNTGLRQAAGEYIAFADADDLWVSDKLEKQLKALRSHQRLVSYSSAEYFYGKAAPQSRKVIMFADEPPKTRKEFLRSLLCGSKKLAVTSSVMFPRDALARTGMFDEDLVNAEDWDLWIRMAEEYDFQPFQEPLFKRRKHAQSLTSGLNVDFMVRNHRKVLDKYCRNHPSDAVLPHRVIYSYHYLDNAYLYHSVHQDGKAFYNLTRAFAGHPLLMTRRNLGLMKDILSEGVLAHGNTETQHHPAGL